MRTTRSRLFGLMISQMLLWSVIVGKSDAHKHEDPSLQDIDGDNPFSVGFGLEHEVQGNPLGEGDKIYSLRGSYRFFSGHLGIEGLLGYADPSSRFVQSLGNDAELLLFDLSVAWYLNYPPERQPECDRLGASEPHIQAWHCGSRVKPEYIIFGGPGWASLRIKDAFPNFPLSDASKDFLTINAGVAVKLSWLRDDPESIAPNTALDHYEGRYTSRWFLRPELRARWFEGGGGEIDWGVGLVLGYSFGDRPSYGALDLKVAEACRLVSLFTEIVGDEAKPGGDLQTEQSDELWEKAREHRRAMEYYKARAVLCGAKCEHMRQSIDNSIEALNNVINKLRSHGRSED